MMAIASRGEIDADLGGQSRKLQFTIGDFEEVEARLGIGIGELIRRVSTSYRLTDVRTVIQVALERTGWKATPGTPNRSATPAEAREQVLEMIRIEGPGMHARTCIRLFNAALEDMPGNAPAPAGESEQSSSTASLSGASSNSAA